MQGICVARKQRRARVCDRSDYKSTATELTGVYWKGKVLLVNKEAHSKLRSLALRLTPMPSWKSTPRRPLGARHNCLGRPREGEDNNEEESTERKRAL